MLTYASRRLLLAIPLLFVVVTLSFFLVRAAPSDPAQVRLGAYASEAAIEAMREEMGLNQPIWNQYIDYMSGLLRGDFGRSLVNQQQITPSLARALSHTLQLTVAGMLLAVLLGIPSGVWTALERNRPIDYLGRTLSLVGLSFPSFFLGILLILLFSIWLGLFPVVGAGQAGNVSSILRHLFVPALTLGLIQASYIARVTRSSVLNLVSADFVRTARSKGVRERKVVFKHVMRNAAISIIGLIGLYAVVLIGGSLMVEIVFARPGLGRMLIGALESRDYTVLQSVLAVYAGLVVLFNLLTDLVVGVIDPRVEYA